MIPKLPIKRFRATTWRNDAKRDAVGSTEFTVNGRHVRVYVFAYAGGEHGEAFTSFKTYINEYEYNAQLPRRYHDRWLLRLALAFEERCWLDAKKLGGGK